MSRNSLDTLFELGEQLKLNDENEIALGIRRLAWNYEDGEWDIIEGDFVIFSFEDFTLALEKLLNPL